MTEDATSVRRTETLRASTGVKRTSALVIFSHLARNDFLRVHPSTPPPPPPPHVFVSLLRSRLGRRRTAGRLLRKHGTQLARLSTLKLALLPRLQAATAQPPPSGERISGLCRALAAVPLRISKIPVKLCKSTKKAGVCGTSRVAYKVRARARKYLGPTRLCTLWSEAKADDVFLRREEQDLRAVRGGGRAAALLALRGRVVLLA